MKKVITILLIQIIISVQLFAQKSQTSISGKVVDDRMKSVEAATISLMKAADSSLFKMSVSDKEGKFSFENVPPAKYYISASAINYAMHNSGVFELNQTSLAKDIDAISLHANAKTLSAVIVSPKRPLIEQKIDRMIVNVDASVTNVGATALEVLEKSPGVSIDKDGNISLKGTMKLWPLLKKLQSKMPGSNIWGKYNIHQNKLILSG